MKYLVAVGKIGSAQKFTSIYSFSSKYLDVESFHCNGKTRCSGLPVKLIVIEPLSQKFRSTILYLLFLNFDYLKIVYNIKMLSEMQILDTQMQLGDITQSLLFRIF